MLYPASGVHDRKHRKAANLAPAQQFGSDHCLAHSGARLWPVGRDS
jgi:hypothetical protein